MIPTSPHLKKVALLFSLMMLLLSFTSCTEEENITEQNSPSVSTPYQNDAFSTSASHKKMPSLPLAEKEMTLKNAIKITNQYTTSLLVSYGKHLKDEEYSNKIGEKIDLQKEALREIRTNEKKAFTFTPYQFYRLLKGLSQGIESIYPITKADGRFIRSWKMLHEMRHRLDSQLKKYNSSSESLSTDIGTLLKKYKNDASFLVGTQEIEKNIRDFAIYVKIHGKLPPSSPKGRSLLYGGDIGAFQVERQGIILLVNYNLTTNMVFAEVYVNPSSHSFLYNMFSDSSKERWQGKAGASIRGGGNSNIPYGIPPYRPAPQNQTQVDYYAMGIIFTSYTETTTSSDPYHQHTITQGHRKILRYVNFADSRKVF